MSWFFSSGDFYPIVVLKPIGEFHNHNDVMKWNIFRVIGPLGGELTGHRWFPLTKASDADLWCFRRSVPEQIAEQTIDVIKKNRYSPLLFTCEDRICTKLHEQQKSTHLTSQCPVPSVRVTSQINYGDAIMLSQKRPIHGNNGERSDWWLFLAELCVQLVRNIMRLLPWMTIFWSPEMWFVTSYSR